MNSQDWKFSIDVGGTFTDVVAVHPLGEVRTLKLLNNVGCRTEGDEEPPVTAIRKVMGLGPDDEIGPIDVRLGTTRATNALLERNGARVLFVTTRGFGDILKIGHQDRPALFDLNIRKREELAECVLEVDERLGADGQVIRPLDLRALENGLAKHERMGLEAVAICLLHSTVNPAHEDVIAKIAAGMGFDHISVSSRVSPQLGLVARGDTTVLDAYLTKVIKGYVRSLRRSMPQARLMLMTSAGGLVPAESIQGKDTILSGPAGGVVGCAHVATKAGAYRAIGFDMGGTSTDVCRVEGDFEYEQETVKAGVRMVMPMLAVETVAAGGGSICTFDGHRLTVGPHSAGADPGPACYGRGGPLTVTDVNLFLGRLSPDYFPFPLDWKIVETRLRELQEQILTASRRHLTLAELAEGFIQIANAHMAAAIQKISIAKGYDVREYALVSFGGAGGQHACAVARNLGIRRVVLSPFAGVLSALGISAAPVRRIVQRGVQVSLSSAAAALQPVFEALEDDLRRRFAEEGIKIDPGRPPVRGMDICYVGQGAMLSVSADPAENVRARFEAKHRQLYGYVHDGRDIEIRVARVEWSVPSDDASIASVKPRVEVGASKETEVYLQGRSIRVPLRPRGTLAAGQRLIGPLLITEEHSTIWVEEGWSAELNEVGDVVLTDAMRGETRTCAGEDADPIQLELFNNRFAAIAEQMGVTLRRTAMSVNVKERLDFSCAVFDARGFLVVNAPHIPVHLGGMSDCVKFLLEDVGSFAPGDVYVTNDPYRGGSHLNDVTVVAPVFDSDEGTPVFLVANRAHHAEIGGTRPGSMPPDSTCLSQEGVLIRAFPLVKDGVARYDEFRLLLTSAEFPSRAPQENLADLAAQVAANQTGVRELQGLIGRHGTKVLQAQMRHIQDAAESKMRAALNKLPVGAHCFEDSLDDGTEIRLKVTLRNSGVSRGDGSDTAQATFDFTGTSPVHAGNLNANRSIVTSAVLYCLRCLIAEDIPLNGGVLAPVEIVLPPCFLNPPGHSDPKKCPAMVGGNVETSQRIVDVVLGALRLVAASQGTMNNLLMGNARFGYYETICGGSGAGPGFAGADAVHTHMTNTRLTDPEILESRYPVRLRRFAIRQGSGGAGRFRGGCGVIRELEFLEPLEVSILSQRRTTAPYGLLGGHSGMSGRNLLRRAAQANEPSGVEEVEQVLPSIARIGVNAGDRLTIETPGGGGYGIPT